MAIEKLKLEETLLEIRAKFRNTIIRKINEIIGITNSNTPTYGVYVAKLTSNGAAAPTANIMYNTLGFTPGFVYNNSDGDFSITSSAKYTLNKTAYYITNGNSSNNVFVMTYVSTNEISLFVGDSFGTGNNSDIDGAILRIEIYQ